METTYTHGKKTIDYINKQMDKKGKQFAFTNVSGVWRR